MTDGPENVFSRDSDSTSVLCTTMPSYTPTLLQHINLAVPAGSLGLATEFYGEVIGFASDPVPHAQRDSLLW
jgi:4-hydroxyphenylpyruvate dioxygenase-like putative hemolysin